MIARVWHGWTRPENADAYEDVLRREIFPGITAKAVSGYRGIELLRRDISDGEVEFATIMWFDTLAAVRGFAGDDYETAYVPEPARALLERYDETSAHYALRERQETV